MSILLVLSGVMCAIIFSLGYGFRNIREVDTLLPDQSKV